MIVGVDVGYGYTKAGTTDGQAVGFPSVTARSRGTDELTRALGGKALPHRLVLRRDGESEAQTLFVGNAALFAGGARSWDARAVGRADYVPLVFTALRLLDVAGEVVVGVGLPLRLYTVADERRALRGSLAGVQALVGVDDRPLVPIRLAEVRVFPQGAAAYFAAVTLDPGLALRPCAVVDVGYRTTDHLLMRLAPGERLARPDERASGSLDMGIERVYATVASELSSRHPAMLEPASVEQAALSDGMLAVQGETVDVRPYVERVGRELATEIAARLKEAWGPAMSQIGTVLLAGGGGVSLFPNLRQVLPNVRVLSDPTSANARGYASLLSASVGAAAV